MAPGLPSLPTASPHHIFTVVIIETISELTPSSRRSGLHVPSHQDEQGECTQLIPLDPIDLF